MPTTDTPTPPAIEGQTCEGLAPRICSGGLAGRWTPEQIEAANSLVNDIAEEIDRGETREELRQAIAIMADLKYDAHNARHRQLSALGLLAFQMATDPSQND